MVPSPLPLLPLLPLCSSDSSPFPSLPFPNPFRIGAATTIASALVANPGTFFLSPESLGLTNMLMNAGEPFPFLSFSPLHSLTHTHMHHACHSSPSPSLSFSLPLPSFPALPSPSLSPLCIPRSPLFPFPSEISRKVSIPLLPLLPLLLGWRHAGKGSSNAFDASRPLPYRGGGVLVWGACSTGCGEGVHPTA